VCLLCVGVCVYACVCDVGREYVCVVHGEWCVFFVCVCVLVCLCVFRGVCLCVCVYMYVSKHVMFVCGMCVCVCGARCVVCILQGLVWVCVCVCVDLFAVHKQAQHAGTARCIFENSTVKNNFMANNT